MKLNEELFDADNYYPYKLWKKELGKIYQEGDFKVNYDNYLYKFTDRNDLSYIVKLSYIKNYPSEEYTKYLTLDYQDQESFTKNLGKDYDLTYKNLNVNDAIKVLNTVMTILKNFLDNFDVEYLVFTCTEDRYKTYLYIVKRHIPYIMVDMSDINISGNNVHVFNFFNPTYFDISSDGMDIIRKDNNVIAYTSRNEEIQ